MDISRFLYTLLCLLGTTWTHALTICDQCDCTLSEDSQDDKGITNVKPPCTEGHVTWTNPNGAMILELKPSHFTDFQACVIIKSENTKTLVSKEINIKNYKNHRTKKFVDKKEVIPWFTVINISKEYCFQSNTNEALRLYIETETTIHNTGLPRVNILYDIEDYSRLKHNPMEECRPCNERELIIAFCTSDFVVVGSMTDINNYPDISKTKIGVEVDQLIHQTTDHFKRVKRSPTLINHHKSTDTLLYGHIYAPDKCGISHGPGTFLFTGRMRLGHPKLRCAAFYDEWKRVVETAERDGTMECSYD